MRTDCTITRKQTFCPTASRAGFSKPYAQVGDIIEFSESGTFRIGRVIGQVKADSRTYVLTIALSLDSSRMTERWVDPSDIYRCFNPKDNPLFDPVATWQGLMSDDIIKPSNQSLARMAANQLWNSWGAFKSWYKSR